MPHIIVDNGNLRMTKQVMVPRVDVIASEDASDYSRLAPVALRLLGEESAKVAVVGLGFGILPRLICRHHHVTAFEIEPAIIEHFRKTFPWARVVVVEGDYANNLRATFDFIVYDVDGQPPDWLSQYGQVIKP